ncbi:MAG: hypothetical protein JNM88_12335 [Chitinophagaceae bacterium]|nr:hypothetical protein [Chitinophagaceae bacterium]
MVDTYDIDCAEVVSRACRSLNVRTNKSVLFKKLTLHPTYPSLLSIKNVFDFLKIDSAAVQVKNRDQVTQLKPPFIAYMKPRFGSFVLVTEIAEEKITYIAGAEKKVRAAVHEFQHDWAGIILMYQKTAASSEPGYLRSRITGIAGKMRLPFVLCTMAFFFHLFAGKYFAYSSNAVFLGMAACNAAGLFFSLQLLMKSYHLDIGYFDRFCNFSEGFSCNSVLNSRFAKIPGLVSLSELGVIFFFISGGLLFYGGHDISLRICITGVMALLALPFTFFSIYYQAFVVKKFCPFCVAIQVLFWIEFILAFSYLSAERMALVPSGTWLVFLSLLLFSVAGIMTARAFIENKIKLEKFENELQRFKGNPEIFKTMLLLKPAVSTNNNNPLLFGPDKAPVVFSILINPFCEICAYTMEKVAFFMKENPERIRLEILFKLYGDKTPEMDSISRSALIITSLYSSGRTEKALELITSDHTYLRKETARIWQEEKASENFLAKGMKILEDHAAWCNETNVHIVPMIFVNYHPLPLAYRIGDMDYLIKNM